MTTQKLTVLQNFNFLSNWMNFIVMFYPEGLEKNYESIFINLLLLYKSTFI